MLGVIRNDTRPLRLNNQSDGVIDKKNDILKETLYRCGWCGEIVDSLGNKLNPAAKAYRILILEKFGDGVSKAVEGYCCKNKKSQN